jgi:serine/threonine protein kinase
MEGSSGKQIGPYQIISLIGQGGMGQVYLAKDQRLGRRVALKFIHHDRSTDEQMRARFIKEARTASALNHPNIVTLYDVTSDGDADVIVMEFLEGESLRSLISTGRLEMKRALEFAAQIASALAAAHKEGIIHRDIKPENIFIIGQNQAKILDFGLAKLIAVGPGDSASELTTAAPPVDETKSGMILGTVCYMSPEQAQGQKLDNRTDIFSLGAVLYEMLTLTRAFKGKSSIDTLHAIMNQEPINARELKRNLPLEGNEILGKALAKNPDERYRHAGDLELDLRRLLRGLETKTLISNQLPVAARSRTSKFFPMLFGALIGVVAILIAWKFIAVPGKATKELSAIERATLTPLTVEASYEASPSFSPDGETIAYVSNRTGNFEIFLKQISGGADINITNNPADDVYPSFSPDGKQIVFVSTRSAARDLHYPIPNSPLVGGDLWIMPAFGGTAKRIAESGSFPSWSPDGKNILYSSGPRNRQKLYTIPAGGGVAHEIPVHFKTAPAFLYYPRYSPTGRWIIFEGGANHIFLINAKGGEPKLILNGTCSVWANDQQIIYSSSEPGKNFSLWRINFSDKEGKVIPPGEPLTLGRGKDLQPTISRDGTRIAFASLDVAFNLETLPLDAETGKISGEPQPLTNGNDIIYFSNFSPDGRTVVFGSQRGSQSHIWQMPLGSSPVELTSDPAYNDNYPRYSPDGKSIAFGRGSSEQIDVVDSIWLMANDGANPQKLISFKAAVPLMFFCWSRDGKSIFYRSPEDIQLHSYQLKSREDHALTNERGVVSPIITPDGKWVLYVSTLTGDANLRAMPASGGSPIVVTASPHQHFHPFFSPSGNWLYYQVEHKNIYRIPGPGQNWMKKEPEKITNFPESGLYLEDPQISEDGKYLLYSRGRFDGDIWIMNLQP